MVFVFDQFGKFRCAMCGILMFFGAVLPFSELPPSTNEEDYETREHCREH